tara:strand:+ start:1155 stop:1331 length:177 start_codon:yes stop_codon:yes gene_type:complete
MVRITMLNKDQHDVYHGSENNERKWCMAYLLNSDIVATTLYYVNEEGLSVEENYGVAQ